MRRKCINNSFIVFLLDCSLKMFSYGSRYLFGKDVDGTAYVVFGVVIKDEKHGLPSSLQRVPVRANTFLVSLFFLSDAQVSSLGSN